MPHTSSVKLLDFEPTTDDGEIEILGGLQRSPKRIAPKYFYDEAGSRLFDLICEQPEYYPTRTELGIMQEHVDEVAERVGPEASLIEFGSGSSIKTRLLLEHLERPAAYVPVDISRDHLLQAAAELAEDHSDIEILPVCADFMRPFDLPQPAIPPRRNLVFFPGSTIGNFSQQDAVELLQVMCAEAREGGALLIGVDLAKRSELLEPAYNDAAGVTADFNLNLLRRLNREYDATFDLDAFEHRAIFDEERSRIEMRLISLIRQQVRVAGERIELQEGEYIVTEHSYKYSPAQFEALANQGGFTVEVIWTDPDELFSVQYLEVA